MQAMPSHVSDMGAESAGEGDGEEVEGDEALRGREVGEKVGEEVEGGGGGGAEVARRSEAPTRVRPRQRTAMASQWCTRN
jgi:hypothetical protein